MSVIDEIKARIDILDLVSESVQLRRSGKNYVGFCPFHSNTRTPAFVVFPETGTWRCFGQCNEGGDIFGFVIKKEGWDFGEALNHLAARAGVQLKPISAREQALADEHENLRSLLEEAVVYYRHNLYNTSAGTKVLDYLRGERRIKDEIIEAFGLGFAPESWEATINYFISKGYSESDLIAAGMASQREGSDGAESGGLFDRFRNRVMIPIRDERGRMCGFGARALNPEDTPKFLNSPQTSLFDKGRLLYGLDRARKAIRAQDQAVIVEGYFDVIALHQAGYENAVSPMGTALTEAQLRLLKRYTSRIVLALDADAAGEKATMRGLEIARQTMDRESEPLFDSRGLLGYEARLQADIRVTTLPEESDPDDVVNDDASAWEKIVGEARPIVEHVMETLLSNRNVDDPKVKTEIAGQVLPLIEDIPSPLERETYRQKLARLLRVDERALLSSGRRGRGARSFPRTKPRTAPEPESKDIFTRLFIGNPLEAHCLGVLLRRPDLVYRIDRVLQENQLVRLSRDDFQSSEYQHIYDLIGDSLKQDHSEPLYYVLNSLSLSMMEMVDDLLARTEKLDPNDERVLEDVIRALLELRQRRVRQRLDYLRFLIEEAQQSGDVRATEYHEGVREYTVMLNRLHRALGK